MKVYQDYDLSDLFKQYVGKSDIRGLSPRIEQDKDEDKYKLRTYEFNEKNNKFNTKKTYTFIMDLMRNVKKYYTSLTHYF